MKNNKEPWLAVNLSRLLPGIGQIYAGSPVKGYIILFSYFILFGIGGWSILSSPGNVLVGIVILIFVGMILPIWNLFDAYHSAKKRNSTEFEADRKQNKDAWLAVFLSGFIPGLGHVYLKQWLSSVIFFTVFIAVAIAAGSKNPTIALLANLLQVALVLIAFYHVYVSAPVQRERSRRTLMLFMAGFISISVVISTILAIAIRLFVAEARYIASGSMQPTLQINDRLIINKLAYRFREPERGDIILFSPTEALQEENIRDAFIQRIIGLPGDRVEIKSGQVYINDRALDETYINERSNYQWGPQIVAPNSYFVLGDNRNNSYDSRYWGFVPRENIIGKATQRFYPFDRTGSLAGK